MAFTLEPLPFKNDALEPYIDTETMRIHHDLHHQAYVKNLEDATKGTEYYDMKLDALNKIAGSLAPAIRNNAGGHWNHTFFWDSLSPAGGNPSDKLIAQLNTNFGSLESFKEKFEQAGLTRFGSGWAWLIINMKTLKFEIMSTPNQDNPMMDIFEVECAPLLAVDVWEHAYYLKYQNKRADYLKNFWNVVNWAKVEDRRHKAIK